MKRFNYILIFSILIFTSCKKDWLEEKSDKSLVIPSTLEDCQLFLDNNSRLNSREPGIGDMGADDYYKIYNDWLSATEMERNIYTWNPSIFVTGISADWNSQYEKIYYSNAVLETLKKINKTPSNEVQWNAVKGSALFFRAHGLYNIVNLYARPYHSTTAGSDLGVPIKLTADINEVVSRGTVQNVFDQILKDLTEASGLLPNMPDYKTRPSEAAVQGLLADVYLTMGNYDKALEYANACLAINSSLLNYNTLSQSSLTPFTRFNNEVIFHATQQAYGMTSSSTAYIDTVLLASYHNNDLRKVLFFRNRGVGFTFKGNYNQSASNYFSGISTDEIFLIRAESFARKNLITEAMSDLNKLLITRWRSGTYVNMSALNQADALTKILSERRKELLFRGKRWMDLRRLNMDISFAVTLTRNLNGVNFTLPPNDKKYVYPIPENEVRLTGLVQNPQ